MNTHQIHPHSPAAGETRTAQPPQLAVDASLGLFLTTRQAADLIAVTPHRLATLRMAHDGPVYYRTPTGAAIYYRQDLLTWGAAAPSQSPVRP